MFDILVESTRGRKSGKTGRYFALTTIIYGLALAAVTIGTIVGFSPVLAEEFMLESMLAPVPSGPQPKAMRVAEQHSAASNIFASPVKPAAKVLPASDVTETKPVYFGPIVDGAPSGAGDFAGVVFPAGKPGNEILPPPPAPKKAPPPAFEEKTRQEPVQVSKGVLQGKVLRRVKPQYSAIARQVRATGAVQVLVTISEEGQVIEATAIEGHPLLRSSAVEAARGWLFSPTMLSDVPVKVQGVLTFNFILQ